MFLKEAGLHKIQIGTLAFSCLCFSLLGAFLAYNEPKYSVAVKFNKSVLVQSDDVRIWNEAVRSELAKAQPGDAFITQNLIIDENKFLEYLSKYMNCGLDFLPMTVPYFFEVYPVHEWRRLANCNDTFVINKSLRLDDQLFIVTKYPDKRLAEIQKVIQPLLIKFRQRWLENLYFQLRAWEGFNLSQQKIYERAVERCFSTISLIRSNGYSGLTDVNDCKAVVEMRNLDFAQQRVIANNLLETVKMLRSLKPERANFSLDMNTVRIRHRTNPLILTGSFAILGLVFGLFIAKFLKINNHK